MVTLGLPRQGTNLTFRSHGCAGNELCGPLELSADRGGQGSCGYGWLSDDGRRRLRYKLQQAEGRAGQRASLRRGRRGGRLVH
jgi:hypothetical protein